MTARKQPSNNGHPDLWELEALRTGEASRSVEDHVRQCARCRDPIRDLEALSADARLHRSSAGEVPKDVDTAVLELIDRRAHQIRWRRSLPRFGRRPAWAAAALVIIAILSIVLFVPQQREFLGARRTPVLEGDIDRSGAIDVVDAYLMAVRLQSGNRIPGSWDVNRDGVIDGGDVDIITCKAVAVAEEVS